MMGTVYDGNPNKPNPVWATGLWCPGPESNRYAPFQEAADFKSAVSTNFTTRARGLRQPQHCPRKNPVPEWTTGFCLEARAGVEPTYTDLQSGA
jgi:hypothetical protein